MLSGSGCLELFLAAMVTANVRRRQPSTAPPERPTTGIAPSIPWERTPASKTIWTTWWNSLSHKIRGNWAQTCPRNLTMTIILSFMRSCQDKFDTLPILGRRKKSMRRSKSKINRYPWSTYFPGRPLKRWILICPRPRTSYWLVRTRYLSKLKGNTIILQPLTWNNLTFFMLLKGLRPLPCTNRPVGAIWTGFRTSRATILSTSQK
jgi:hypothetical protein